MRHKKLILGFCVLLALAVGGSLGLIGGSARAATSTYRNLTVSLTGEGAAIGAPPYTAGHPFAASLQTSGSSSGLANCGVVDNRVYGGSPSFTGTGQVYCRRFRPGRPTYGDITFTIVKGTTTPPTSGGAYPPSTTETVKVTGGDGYFKGATGTGTETGTLIPTSPAYYTLQWTLTIRVQRVELP